MREPEPGQDVDRTRGAAATVAAGDGAPGAVEGVAPDATSDPAPAASGGSAAAEAGAPTGLPMPSPRPGDRELVARLLEGHEPSFAAVVREHHTAMLRVARIFVRSPAVAEEVVQETWIAILGGLPRFQGRSSLKTWMYRILTNRAKTRARREGRVVPLSSLGPSELDGEPAVSPDRFDASGHWRPGGGPVAWARTPDRLAEDAELMVRIEAALATLPERQRMVVTLRDVQGFDAAEVCNVLEISETNQRVLLHRGRSKVRAALEAYLAGDE